LLQILRCRIAWDISRDDRNALRFDGLVVHPFLAEGSSIRKNAHCQNLALFYNYDHDIIVL